MKPGRGSTLEVLNEAIELTRSEALRHNLAAAAPGLCLTWLVLFAYYLEQVEGLHTLRPLCALGLTLGWCARALVLTRYAGRCVERELAHLPPAARHSALETRLRVALVLGTELWLWLWLLVWCVRIDPWLCALFTPVFALRGALWPGWLAAADSAQAGTARSAAWYVLRAGQGQRLTGIALELALSLSALALFFNLGALIVAAISLAQDLLGLRLAFVRAFISPRNHFALLALVGVTLSAFDPLRAAAAAVLYADTRRDRAALEVRALVEAAIAPRAGKALLLLLGVVLLGAPAQSQAQPWSPVPPLPGLEEECDPRCREAQARDDQVLVRLVSILEAPEFRDFAMDPASLPELERPSFERWLERLGRWLSGVPEQAPERGSDLSRVAPVHLPLKLLLAGLGLLVLGLASLGLWHVQKAGTPRRAPAPRPAAAHASSTPPRPDTSPRGVLRAAYLTALESLAQRGLLTLSRASTNGDYLRMLQSSPVHGQLARLTWLFERALYGQSEPSQQELQEAHTLTRALERAEEPP